MIAILFAAGACYGQSFKRPPGPKQNRSLIRKSSGKHKSVRIRESRHVGNVKRKAEAKDEQLKKEYAEGVRNNQKRSIEIQTPEVRARMKQNKKDSDANYKARKKKNGARGRKAGRKYR